MYSLTRRAGSSNGRENQKRLPGHFHKRACPKLEKQVCIEVGAKILGKAILRPEAELRSPTRDHWNGSARNVGGG